MQDDLDKFIIIIILKERIRVTGLRERSLIKNYWMVSENILYLSPQ
jgi:hypothetical protein